MSSEQNDTRTRILEATVAMLERHQGRGVRMGDIAKAAGLSRQAVYLHFPSRTELLIAATRHVDQVVDVDSRLAASRAASSGIERLDLWIEAWGSYIPKIYSVAKALMLAEDSDEAAAAAWADRMQAMRDGCRAAIARLDADGDLAADWTPKRATEALWTLLLVPNWEHLTTTCGWSGKQYIRSMQLLARRAFVRESS